MWILNTKICLSLCSSQVCQLVIFVVIRGFSVVKIALPWNSFCDKVMLLFQREISYILGSSVIFSLPTEFTNISHVRQVFTETEKAEKGNVVYISRQVSSSLNICRSSSGQNLTISSNHMEIFVLKQNKCYSFPYFFLIWHLQ